MRIEHTHEPTPPKLTVMNVFEDLIDELKGDNLLEATILEPSRKTDASGTSTEEEEFEIERGEHHDAELAEPEDSDREAIKNSEPPADSAEFYRKRAMDEVSSLQMVEHMISAIEREYMKTVPTPYDDLEAKKALHKFLQVSGRPDTLEYAEAEYALLHETESWASALAMRDANISVGNLRRFCENSRPPLSSQAMMSLARFYRNGQYSDVARGKFDFVMTRLFSRDDGDEKRRLLFSRGEMVGHIRTLYAGWTSVSYYSEDERAEYAEAVGSKFNGKAAEAESALDFDSLVESGFFEHLQSFKESIGEIFYVPEVTAAAIECNVRVGNRFVELVSAERRRTPAEKIEEKYGYTYDQIISDSAGKTLHLVDLLKALPEETLPAVVEPKHGNHEVGVSSATKVEANPARPRFALKVNKWILLATIAAAVLSGAMYFWSDSYAADEEAVPAAKQVDLRDNELGQYLRSGRTTSTTFYAVAEPNWDTLTADQQKEILQKAATFARKMKLKKVQIVNFKGRSVGYVSGEKVEVVSP